MQRLFMCFSVLMLSNIIISNGQPKISTNDWILHSSADKEAVEKLLNDTHFRVIDEIVTGFFWVKELRNPVKRSISSRVSATIIKRCDHIISFERQLKRKMVFRSTSAVINDPYWSKQWYLNDAKAIPSMNIQKAWAKGYTGKGVVIGVVDGGVDITHPDLSSKVDKHLSYDFIENDNDPSPASHESHGTKCAGIAVAARNNMNCIVGASFGSTFANLRISDGFGSTSLSQSRALKYKYAEIHIYTNSWGVIDGQGFEQQPPIVANAITESIQKGRNGRGSIFVWASGNGGNTDNCNCDGYAKSVNVISIASLTENQYAGYYSEYCSAILASCYSGDDVHYDILTTDLGRSCANFSGTSASTPLAAAVIAMTLEANSSLTYRDIQHLLVSTSQQHSLLGRVWNRNGAGFMFNDLYGFGLLDADSLTEKARSWNLVPFQHICKSDKMVVNRSTNKSVTSSIKSNSCSATEYDEVNFLEHVEIEVAFSATKHGAVEMDLTSPSGTTSHMLTLRQHDTHSGDKTWRFMSVHFWGENPKGQWTMKMSTPVYSESGKLYNWQLILYGTKYNPAFGRQHEDKQRIEVATSTTGRRSRKSDTTKEKNGICQNTALCVIVIIVVILFGSIVIFAIRYLIIKQKNINKVKQETKLEHSKQTNISEECIRF